MGIDNSDSDKFIIANGIDIGSNAAIAIDTSGNVGIGTAAPSEKLGIGSGNIGFVSGTSRITWNDGGQDRSYIQRTRADGDYFTIANNNNALGIQLGTQDGTNPFNPKVTMTSMATSASGRRIRGIVGVIKRRKCFEDYRQRGGWNRCTKNLL